MLNSTGQLGSGSHCPWIGIMFAFNSMTGHDLENNQLSGSFTSDLSTMRSLETWITSAKKIDWGCIK